MVPLVALNSVVPHARPRHRHTRRSRRPHRNLMAPGRFPLIVRWGTPPASGRAPPANQMVRVMSEPGATPEGTANDLGDVRLRGRPPWAAAHGDADAERARRTRAAVEVLGGCLLDRETPGT